MAQTRAETVLRVVAGALTAIVDEPGFPRVPDWPVRLAACALLLECFPTYMRESPQDVRELLDRLLPVQVHDSRLTPDAAHKALATEKHRLRERGNLLSQSETARKT